LKGLAHITGGGFPDNIPRVLPDGAGVALDLARVPVLPVFKWLAATGGIAEPEMLRTFNCGIGMIAIVDAGGADAITGVLERAGEMVVRLGTVTTSAAGAPRVAYSGKLDLG
jgi:phosphoribosylformylglycinamidine cyclo-ligase